LGSLESAPAVATVATAASARRPRARPAVADFSGTGFKKGRARPVDPAADRKRLAHNASNSAYKRRKRLDLVQIKIEVPAFATPDWLRDERFLDDWDAEQRPLNKGDKAKVRDALGKYVRLRSRYGSVLNELRAEMQASSTDV
jgi:hypothetical protein